MKHYYSDKSWWIMIAACALFAVSIITLTVTNSKAQAVFHNCPIGGIHPNYDDSMKNRYDIPDAYTTIQFDQLAALKVNAALPKGAISFTGYCILVKDGGGETCNCKSKDVATHDTHIEITIDDKHLKNTDAIVCEVNGRVRALMLAMKVDWSTKTLTKLLVGHTIEIGGYAFTDDHHWQNSVDDEPNGTDNWRKTCVEIHPVTYIKVIQ